MELDFNFEWDKNGGVVTTGGMGMDDIIMGLDSRGKANNSWAYGVLRV